MMYRRITLKQIEEILESNKMWYKTEVEAKAACFEKERKYKQKFFVLKDPEKEDCYWAQREMK